MMLNQSAESLALRRKIVTPVFVFDCTCHLPRRSSLEWETASIRLLPNELVDPVYKSFVAFVCENLRALIHPGKPWNRPSTPKSFYYRRKP